MHIHCHSHQHIDTHLPNTQVRLMLTDEAFDDASDESGWEGDKGQDDDPKRPRIRSLPQAVTKVRLWFSGGMVENWE